MSKIPKFPIDLVVGPYGLQPNATRYLGNAGGFSGADFWRFEAAGEQSLCLKRWPAATPRDRVAEVHAAIFQAANAGISFLAVPRLNQTGGSYFESDNRVCEIAPWLVGSPELGVVPSRARLLNAMRALGQFHQAVVYTESKPKSTRDLQPAPGILARQRRLTEFAAGGCQRIEAAIQRRTEHYLAAVGAAILPVCAARLEAVRPALDAAARLPVSVQICLRDVRREHVLFDGDRVSGVVDYDAMRTDNVALDAARLAQSLVGNDEALWRHAISGYESVRPLSGYERQLLPALRAANPVLSALTWLEWLFVEGRRFEDMKCVERRLRQLVALLQ